MAHRHDQPSRFHRQTLLKDFYDQLLASAPDPATGKPDPARMSAFLAKHPETAKAMEFDPRSSVLVRVGEQHVQQSERIPFHQCWRRPRAGSLGDGAGPSVRANLPLQPRGRTTRIICSML